MLKNAIVMDAWPLWCEFCSAQNHYFLHHCPRALTMNVALNIAVFPSRPGQSPLLKNYMCFHDARCPDEPLASATAEVRHNFWRSSRSRRNYARKPLVRRREAVGDDRSGALGPGTHMPSAKRARRICVANAQK